MRGTCNPILSNVLLRTISCALVVGSVFVIAPAVAYAELEPDPTLWGPDTVVNPSSLRPVPIVGYDPDTGILFLDNLGLDRISNTVGGNLIGGDDVGTISLLIRGPEPTGNFEPFLPKTFDPINGIAWNYEYFNGRAQLIGTAVSGQYIRPGVNNILQYETGLTPIDFQDVEMGVNFQSGQPGSTIFGSVQFVPEPMGWLLSPVLLLIAGVLMKRHGGSSRRG